LRNLVKWYTTPLYIKSISTSTLNHQGLNTTPCIYSSCPFKHKQRSSQTCVRPAPFYSIEATSKKRESRSKKQISRTTAGSSYQQSLRACTASKICTCIDVKIRRGIETFVLRIEGFNCIAKHRSHRTSHRQHRYHRKDASAVFIDFLSFCPHTGRFVDTGVYGDKGLGFCDSLGTQRVVVCIGCMNRSMQGYPPDASFTNSVMEVRYRWFATLCIRQILFGMTFSMLSRSWFSVCLGCCLKSRWMR
jgi:hypothetical protein